jgi:Protein kinase domain
MIRDPDRIETIAEPISPIPPTRAQKERFPPGTLLASRYRIVSCLGKGGMGEVFRADDLILGQPVALKFLPESAKSNVNLLTRFYDEVRIARQISHKNVCRVYDIGEVEGQPYLSMEYIDGEDLGSLLRRIGRLPADKATEFARKLCAAVAAAHAQGVLHRDLKPANIMIDARGELRVTDFGLAAIAEQLKGDEIRSGTPAYMAPEQLTGTEVSAQSDLYAVGLILYEMFTGKLPHQADSIAEITRLRQESRTTNPSALVGDLDKAVERAVLRCLEPDPKMRPASALALSGSLPGGDPLAAALADGVTPSPEVVAAAGPTEALPLKVAIPALAGIAVGMIVFCVAIPRVHLINLVPIENPPEVLTAKARDIVKSLGYSDRAADRTSNFWAEYGYVTFMQSKRRDMEEWARVLALPPSAIGYWYRQGPTPLAAEQFSSNGEAGVGDPPVTVPGMLTVVMDMDGSLRRFAAVPPEREAPPAQPAALPDWAPLFSAAHLDPEKFTPVAPEWTPPVAADTREAWKGFYRDRSDLPVRVEAASFHNRPVYFQVLWPWTRADRSTPGVATGLEALRSLANYVIGAIVLIAALWIAHYNWKAGRGDLRGAARVGIYCAGMSLIAWILNAHHVASDAEKGLIENALAQAVYLGIEYWLIYLAVEPWVRRYWPQTMITWSRVLAGKWRDPLVGRDLLFGTLLGIVYLLLVAIYEYANLRSGAPILGEIKLKLLNGFRPFAGNVAGLLFGEVGGSLVFLLTLFLVRALLKKQSLVAVVWVVGWVAVRFLRGGSFLESSVAKITTGVFWLLLFTILVFIMLRLGFFALVVAIFVLDSVSASFLTTDFSAWYGQSSLAIVILIGAMALWGFRLSVGSRPLFSAAALENT